MKIYVAGPITGIPEHNRPAFESARASLEAAGHDVTIPLDVLPYQPELTWQDYMRAGLRAMLKCDEIRVLPGWEFSRGTMIEVDVAMRLGIPVKSIGPTVGATEAELRYLDEVAP